MKLIKVVFLLSPFSLFLNAAHGPSEQYYRQIPASGTKEAYFLPVSGRSSKRETMATHIRGMQDDKIPLYATRTSCKTKPGVVNVYALNEKGAKVHGRDPRGKTAIMHFCVTEDECYVSSAFGWGYAGLSGASDGNTPTGNYRMWPITQWPSNWGTKKQSENAKDGSEVLVDRYEEHDNPMYLWLKESPFKESFDRNPSELAWHHKYRGGKVHIRDDYDYTSSQFCRTAGCLRSRHVNANSPDGVQGLLPTSYWAFRRLQAEMDSRLGLKRSPYNSRDPQKSYAVTHMTDSLGSENLVAAKKDEHGALVLDSARQQLFDQYNQELDNYVSSQLRARMPGHDYKSIAEYPNNKDSLKAMSTSRDSDFVDGRREFFSMPLIFTEHNAVRFDVDAINDPNGQAIKVDIGGQLVGMCKT